MDFYHLKDQDTVLMSLIRVYCRLQKKTFEKATVVATLKTRPSKKQTNCEICLSKKIVESEKNDIFSIALS